MTTSRSAFLVALTAFLNGAIVIALYWTGLFGGFFFDDGPSILQVAGVRMETLSLESLHAAFTSGGAGPTGRPMAQLTFAINYFFNGYDAFAFKATNLFIHYCCGLLVFGLYFQILVGLRPHAKQRFIVVASAALAALWLLSPIQLLPVLHVVQRMTSLSAMFLFAALLLHIRGREKGGRGGVVLIAAAWCLVWPMSVFSKETGLLFPLFALAWELILRRAAKGALDRFARVFAIVIGLFILAGLVYLLLPQSQWLWAGYQIRPFSAVERLLTETRILWFYLGLVIFPRLEALGLYHDDIALSTNLISPWTTLPAIAGLVGLVYLVWRIRDRAPLVSFGIVWFFVGHIVESTVLPLELAHEHRNYVPLFGFFLVGAWAFIRSLESKKEIRTAGIAFLAVMLTYNALITGLRADQFGDTARRTQVEAMNHRTSARAQHEAGQFLAGLAEASNANEPTFSLARAHFLRACELDGNSKMCALGPIYLSCKAGVAVHASLISELGRRLKETPFAPGDRSVLNNIKEMAIAETICLTRPDIDGLFAAALANPSVAIGVQAMLHSWHADYLWVHEHDMDAARHALGHALALNPGNPSNRLKWAQLLFIAGEHADVVKLLLALRGENLSGEERKTLEELLAAINIQTP